MPQKIHQILFEDDVFVKLGTEETLNRLVAQFEKLCERR